MSDVSFNVSEKWLEKGVLLRNNLCVIEDVLHGLVVSLLREHRQLLKFSLVFAKVEDSLRQDDVRVDLVMKVS